ncbi:MAG: ClpXP protease specificity-enhancing factor SspB, partial [Pseudomonadota bacterium]
RQQYPDVMTIVLQHRFWDLAVSDDRFEVKLTFDSIPERLVVPYAAIKVFFDPSVRYALQFDAPDIDGTGDTRAGPAQPGTMTARPTERSLTPVQPRPVATLDRPMRAAPALVPVDGSDDTNAADGSSEDEPHDVDVPADQDTVGFDQDIADTGSTVEPFRPRATERTVGEDDDPVTADAASEGDDIPPEDGDEDPEDQSAVVVSLDAFRKK